MTNIKETCKKALPSDGTSAANLRDGFSGSQLAQVLSMRMTPTLPAFIATKFGVVAHDESTDAGNHEFDPTVWRQIKRKSSLVPVMRSHGQRCVGLSCVERRERRPERWAPSVMSAGAALQSRTVQLTLEQIA